jgi:16S rRNA (guanine527-N7)-methyltransferase
MKDFSNQYLELLNGPFASLNLTRINSPEEFYQKQIVDSLLPTEIFETFESAISNGLHIDIGFGGGFPLLPLAKKYPEANFIGLEARRKKADAVRDIAGSLSLINVKTFHQRVEGVLFDEKCSISFKAVGKIKDFIKKINNTAPVTIFFYKGPNVKDLEVVPEKIGSFRKILDAPYELSGAEGRYFIAYHSDGVPRGTKKELVKVTELI